jgi:hypothetical protein
LRVLSGRLKAVLVASLATIILVGILAPTTTLASDPPGLARFMYALGEVESGGNYYARNASSGAYGKYQNMPASWRAWADRYLGDAYAKPTPANQEIVATAKVRTLWFGLRSWRRVAYWWLTGSSATSGRSSFATRYVDRVMAIYNRTTTTTSPTTTVALRRYSEQSAAIAYKGTWKMASHPAYTGDHAKWATTAGATATFTFSGSRVIWYGPVGPTRGKARVLIDGVYVKTVDLYRTAFTAHKALFSRSWAAAGKHSLVIQVVGTKGHPYVAIDDFAVAN